MESAYIADFWLSHTTSMELSSKTASTYFPNEVSIAPIHTHTHTNHPDTFMHAHHTHTHTHSHGTLIRIYHYLWGLNLHASVGVYDIMCMLISIFMTSVCTHASLCINAWYDDACSWWWKECTSSPYWKKIQTGRKPCSTNSQKLSSITQTTFSQGKYH